MKIDICAFSRAGSVKNHSKRPLRGNLLIKMLEGAGGGVARIREQR